MKMKLFLIIFSSFFIYSFANFTSIKNLTETEFTARAFEIFKKLKVTNDYNVFKARFMNHSFWSENENNFYENRCESDNLEICEANFITDSINATKSTIQSEILQACQSLDTNMDCLLKFMARCPKMERPSLITILSYIFENNRNVIEDCKHKREEWTDPASKKSLEPKNLHIQSDRDVCITQKDIKKCDEMLGDFDVGRDVFMDSNNCNKLTNYHDCISDIIDESLCGFNAKNMSLLYLNSRIKVANDICGWSARNDQENLEEQILVESGMQSAVDSEFLIIDTLLNASSHLCLITFFHHKSHSRNSLP